MNTERSRNKLLTILVIIMVSLFILCTKKSEIEPEEIILARIGDKTISLNEFIRRAEYNIRPVYCKGSNNIHKKIVLNSLIAEKMLALEAGEDNKLSHNKHYQRFIQGRREQAMRQWLYHKEGIEKVKLDTAEIKKVYQVAGRKYNVSYYSINNDSMAEIIGSKLKESKELFDQIYFELSGSDTIPQREVDYNVHEHSVIHNALFSGKIKVGEVIGPLKVGNGSHIFLKVNGWSGRPAITEKDRIQRWNDVKERLAEKEALQIYEEYIHKIMKGKKVDFFPDIFYKLVDLVGPQYFSTQEKGKELFLHMALDKKIENPLYEIGEGIEDIIDEPLFQVDEKIWTVREFGKEMEIHPLVYRNKRMIRNEFGKQFKLAIVDMIRDKYLAEEAYKKGYDKVNVVKRNTEMWNDACLALYQKSKYLKEINPEEEDVMSLITKYLNPYVDELQEKYNDVIEVNVEEFDKIKLTRIDMFVTQSNVPFPIIVPSFPQVTTDHKLDYGRGMGRADN
ncbi:MAG: hypothetical protein DRP89_01930 [Candidatus Neomarinimicrobiota bacterium]|nr:MAG: hypothetical protein DRP89_01930 [Candidatus Neomarinimicrobiota bacterium]